MHEHNEQCEWGIDLGIPFNSNIKGLDALEVSHDVTLVIGCESSGGGGGFGFRDLQWEGLTESAAKGAYDRAVKFLKELYGKVHDDSIIDAVMTGESNEAVLDDFTVPYVTTLCITENNEEAYPELGCDSQIIVGSTFDPDGSNCIKHPDFHEDKDNNDMHVGHSPYDEGGWVRWQGGGCCAGDPLPVRNIQFDNVVFDYDSYRQHLKDKIKEQHNE